MDDHLRHRTPHQHQHQSKGNGINHGGDMSSPIISAASASTATATATATAASLRSPYYERITSFSFDNEPLSAPESLSMNGDGHGTTNGHINNYGHSIGTAGKGTGMIGNDGQYYEAEELPPVDDPNVPWQLHLVTFDQLLPRWRRDNEFIRTGYIQNAGTRHKPLTHLSTLVCSHLRL
jgi:hypothetical protein